MIREIGTRAYVEMSEEIREVLIGLMRRHLIAPRDLGALLGWGSTKSTMERVGYYVLHPDPTRPRAMPVAVYDAIMRIEHGELLPVYPAVKGIKHEPETNMVGYSRRGRPGSLPRRNSSGTAVLAAHGLPWRLAKIRHDGCYRGDAPQEPERLLAWRDKRSKALPVDGLPAPFGA
jgi:hypothetical protein